MGHIHVHSQFLDFGDDSVRVCKLKNEGMEEISKAPEIGGFGYPKDTESGLGYTPENRRIVRNTITSSCRGGALVAGCQRRYNAKPAPSRQARKAAKCI